MTVTRNRTCDFTHTRKLHHLGTDRLQLDAGRVFRTLPVIAKRRTGRIDRLGCKAEGHYPIVVYLPYLAGTADERQYRVMSEREQWFRVVMGQDEVARLITPESTCAIHLPETVSDELSFKLGI